MGLVMSCVVGKTTGYLNGGVKYSKRVIGALGWF